MNENERTAVNQLKNIREVSAVKLKKIDKGSPDAKPLVYISNIKRADILLRMINELEAYRAIGTVEECRAAVEKQKKGLSVDEAKAIAAKAICIGCGYLTGYECSYNGGNCMTTKPMLESVSKSFDEKKEEDERWED